MQTIIQWTNIKDALPEKKFWVLSDNCKEFMILTEDNPKAQVAHYDGGCWVGLDLCTIHRVTHWAHMPEIAKQMK